MEGWKSGRMEEWKNGRMEEWKNGRMEGWKIGSLHGPFKTLKTVLDLEGCGPRPPRSGTTVEALNTESGSVRPLGAVPGNESSFGRDQVPSILPTCCRKNCFKSLACD